MIDDNTYTLNSSISGIEMSSDGTVTVGITAAEVSSEYYKASVIVGSQTIESPGFKIQVLPDCTLYVTFPDLLTEYIGTSGS